MCTATLEGSLVLSQQTKLSLKVLTVSKASLTFMVEVIDIVWTGGGDKLSRRSFRPTNDAIPFW